MKRGGNETTSCGRKEGPGCGDSRRIDRLGRAPSPEVQPLFVFPHELPSRPSHPHSNAPCAPYIKSPTAMLQSIASSDMPHTWPLPPEVTAVVLDMVPDRPGEYVPLILVCMQWKVNMHCSPHHYRRLTGSYLEYRGGRTYSKDRHRQAAAASRSYQTHIRWSGSVIRPLHPRNTHPQSCLRRDDLLDFSIIDGPPFPAPAPDFSPPGILNGQLQRHLN
jgi:hypothetical protein